MQFSQMFLSEMVQLGALGGRPALDKFLLQHCTSGELDYTTFFYRLYLRFKNLTPKRIQSDLFEKILPSDIYFLYADLIL